MKKETKKVKEKSKKEEIQLDEPKVKSSITKKFGLTENCKVLLG